MNIYFPTVEELISEFGSALSDSIITQQEPAVQVQQFWQLVFYFLEKKLLHITRVR